MSISELLTPTSPTRLLYKRSSEFPDPTLSLLLGDDQSSHGKAGPGRRQARARRRRRSLPRVNPGGSDRRRPALPPSRRQDRARGSSGTEVEVGGAPAASTGRSRPRRRGSPVFVALRKIKDEDRPGDAGGAGRHPERVPSDPARAASGRERPRPGATARRRPWPAGA